MTYPFSGPDTGTRISATVKWYDPAKGYGFLVPDDGSPDIFCRASVLATVGLSTLLAGATVECDIGQGARGPEVSRILAVDFSATPPGAAHSVRPPAERLTTAGPGMVRAGPAASDGRIRALVKWFDPGKGYGFLEPEDGSSDLFCHLSAVQASGRDTLHQDAAVTCEVVQGDRGPQVSRILSVGPPAAGSVPPVRSQTFDTRYPGPQAKALPSPVRELPCTVKFFDPRGDSVSSCLTRTVARCSSIPASCFVRA